MTTYTIDLSAQTTLNLTLRAARYGDVTVTVTRGGAALNLTGASIRYYAATPTALSKTVGSGITVINAAGGIFKITFAASDLSGITAATRVAHECAIKPSGEDILPLFEGELFIETSQFSAMS